MSRYILFLLLLSFGETSFACKALDSIDYKTEKLSIYKISDNVYRHVSYLQVDGFGKVSCNGMVVINNQEAVVFDTPANTDSAEELISHLAQKGIRIKAIIATHFHEDCVGGLKTFHSHHIASYAHKKTIVLLKEKEPTSERPENTFADSFKLKVGDKKVEVAFPGEGHTIDNVVGYFPDEQILFGGCLVKEIGASKGNLADANTQAWASSVKKIKLLYPNVKIVIPGHGKPGGVELLDYTIGLFK